MLDEIGKNLFRQIYKLSKPGHYWYPLQLGNVAECHTAGNAYPRIRVVRHDPTVGGGFGKYDAVPKCLRMGNNDNRSVFEGKVIDPLYLAKCRHRNEL